MAPRLWAVNVMSNVAGVVHGALLLIIFFVTLKAVEQ